MVDRIIYTENMIKVKIRRVVSPIPGDKMLSANAQKSTISKILPDSQMPYILGTGDPETATRVTIIMNPHAIPSRMTINQLIEMIVGKKGALAGERVNATAFNDFNIEDFTKVLKKMYGYNEWGWETMVNGMTGEKFKAQIFTGPVLYQAMKHRVSEKAQSRSEGVIDERTRQAPGGRSRGGALRFGEMEKDGIVSHGASALIQETFCKSSDKFTCTVCTTCNRLSYVDSRKKFVCRNCEEDESTFSKVEVPYSYMMISRYLAASGIDMQLVTKEGERVQASNK